MTAPEQTIERFRNILAFFLVGAFISVLPLLVFRTIPTDNKEVIVYMIGQLSGMATMALGFYFTNKVGADAIDAKRADTTGEMAKAINTALNTPTAPDPPPTPTVTLAPGEQATVAAQDEPAPAGND